LGINKQKGKEKQETHLNKKTSNEMKTCRNNYEPCLRKNNTSITHSKLKPKQTPVLSHFPLGSRICTIIIMHYKLSSDDQQTI